MTDGITAALKADLIARLEAGLASGSLLPASSFQRQRAAFLDRFGTSRLRSLSGEVLLRAMHGRGNDDDRSLVYWLEYKNDDEFEGHRYGSISGGSALKFGLFQRQPDGAWIAGAATKQRLLEKDEAIRLAERQRDQLAAGDGVIAAMDDGDTSDAAYARLQQAMARAAPELHQAGWAHKYWYLCHPDRLDDFHSPRWQRFHLLKLLQRPPDVTSLFDNDAARFNCAGRYVAIAHAIGAELYNLGRILNQRTGGMHRYWRVGTSEGRGGTSHWHEMRDGGFASIGWGHLVPDLSPLLVGERAAAKASIRDFLLGDYADRPGVATGKSTEILNFAAEMTENDVVVACEGQTVLGIGRVSGPYYHGDGAFPHRRPVRWLDTASWRWPDHEGLQTTVKELGRSTDNILEIERRISDRNEVVAPPPDPEAIVLSREALRIDDILRRKGQVIVYGPPGTGKTHHAVAAARAIAARDIYGRSFDRLSDVERQSIESSSATPGERIAHVTVCTFHPGWGYEDFVEGLRPVSQASGLSFEPRDGLFKRVCTAARGDRAHPYILVIDEINRGDLPRILGELLTVLELDKRDRPVTLPVTAESFRVPTNVFIIGTMNTADRSISLLDAALRRRFGFVELMPDTAVLAGRHAGALPLGPWLDALNARIRKHLRRDARNLQVGHAYLLTPQRQLSIADFARIVRDDILPLVEDYCYDDIGTLAAILGEALIDVSAHRVRHEILESGDEDRIVQALNFPEVGLYAKDVETETTADGEAVDGAEDDVT